jgi:hypothetical protein
VADYSLEKYIGQGIDNRYLKGSIQGKAPLILLTSHNFVRTLQDDGQYRQALSEGRRRTYRRKFTGWQTERSAARQSDSECRQQQHATVH